MRTYKGKSVFFIVAATLLVLLLIYLQTILWIGEGSLAEVWRLKQSISELEEKNSALRNRNEKLMAEVEDLKSGLELIEYRARKDLGMIKEGEIFYRVIDGRDKKKDKQKDGKAGKEVPAK